MMRDCQSQALVWSLAAFCSEVTVDIASLVICAGLPGVARRQVTFFASPKKVGKERRPEVRRRCAVPCVTRNDRPLRNSGSIVYRTNGFVCARPQTVLADYSCRFCVTRRLSSGPGRFATTVALPRHSRVARESKLNKEAQWQT